MLVDYERGFLELRARLLEKNSWGQRELLVLLTRIEVECQVPEGEEGFESLPLRTRHTGGSGKQSATNGHARAESYG